jgi:hypothetical protein
LRVLRTIVALLVVGAVFGPATPSMGFEREGMAVSRDDPKVEKTYDDPIVGNNTSLLHRPTDCRTSTYCDVVELTVDARDFGARDVYTVYIKMTWPNPEANDLDLYLYDSQELRIGQAATGDPEEETQIDLPETGSYYLVVNNFAGPNLGYTFSLNFKYEGTLKEIPEFQRATPRPIEEEAPPADTKPLATVSPASPAPETDLERPEATLAPILTPGPDGAPTTLSLEAVQAGGPVEGGGLSWWATAVVIALSVAMFGGLSFFVYRRFRTRGA